MLITFDKRTFIVTTTFQGQSQSTNIYGREVYMGKNNWSKIIIKEYEFQDLLNTLSVYQTDKMKHRDIDGHMIEVFVPVVEMKGTTDTQIIDK